MRAQQPLAALLVQALAIGAIAMGAIALGAVAIGLLAVRKARFGEVEIDRLTVHHIDVKNTTEATPSGF